MPLVGAQPTGTGLADLDHDTLRRRRRALERDPDAVAAEPASAMTAGATVATAAAGASWVERVAASGHCATCTAELPTRTAILTCATCAACAASGRSQRDLGEGKLRIQADERNARAAGTPSAAAHT
ncbi:MAG TPA: hypothetical protein VLS89_16605, partial [Candidatus Nanopelagicales bacterium]|nr:hypothetical protein [Candidatus Nanopelagicales bacterium]